MLSALRKTIERRRQQIEHGNDKSTAINPSSTVRPPSIQTLHTPSKNLSSSALKRCNSNFLMSPPPAPVRESAVEEEEQECQTMPAPLPVIRQHPVAIPIPTTQRVVPPPLPARGAAHA